MFRVGYAALNGQSPASAKEEHESIAEGKLSRAGVGGSVLGGIYLAVFALGGIMGELVKKLAEAMEKVGGVEKKGRNQAQSYDYVKAADVAKALRHELFQRGIVIIPDEVECLNKQLTFTNAKGDQRQVNEVQVKTAYHITDGSETLTMSGYGIAWDSGDKAIYKAKTGALKYFLRGLGLVPDEKDDPEADESVDKVLVDKKAEKSYKKDYEKRTADQARKITPSEAKVFWAAVKKGGKTDDQVKAYFKSLKIDRTEAMLYTDFDGCLKWASGMEIDLTATLKKSVEVTHNFPKLFAKAKEKGIPETDVRQLVHEVYKVESMKDLTHDQFEAVIEWVEQQGQSA
jgi:hypothetical protein